MARNLKENLDLFTKKLKEFKKVFKKDKPKAIEISKEVSKISDKILNSEELTEKQRKQILKAKDSMEVFNSTLESVEEFKKRWEK